MKKILLLHPRMLFYKVKIFNKLSYRLRQNNIELIVWCEEVDNQNVPIEFSLIEVDMTIKNFINVMKKDQIDLIINHLFGKRVVLLYWWILFYCKFFSVKHCYYGHGLDLRSADRIVKKQYQNILHCFFDSILLYTKKEKQFLWRIHSSKTFVANNSLVLDGYDLLLGCDTSHLKRKYGIQEKFVVLFCGRIEPRKKLSILLEIFKYKDMELSDIALVVVGGGIPSLEMEKISKMENVYYFGAVYDQKKINDLFFMSDIFCIPGHIGLGLVEAFYWGKPVLTMPFKHAPEIYYLKDGYNGYIADSKDILLKHIVELSNNREQYENMSNAARKTYLKDANIDKMFLGFDEVLQHCGIRIDVRYDCYET